MAVDNPAVPQQPPGVVPQTLKPQRRKWVLLLLALSCCCGSPFVMFWFVTVNGGRQVTRLHEHLKPGMSVVEVLGQVDKLKLSGLGLSRVFASAQATVTVPSATDSSHSCPVEMSLIWGPDGPPWGRRSVPSMDEAARRLMWCDAIEFRLVVHFTRFHFKVKLKDGRVTGLTPVEGQLT